MLQGRFGNAIEVLLLLFVLLTVVGIQLGAFSYAQASGLSSIVLVFVTLLYTMNTREQVSTTRASYAPALDIEVTPNADYLSIGITNRGEGVAKDIVVMVRANDYEYRAFINKSLRPGQRLESTYGETEGRLSIVPRFYVSEMSKVDEDRTPPRRIFKQARYADRSTPIDDANKAVLTLPELLGFLGLAEEGFNGKGDEQRVPFENFVEYSDVNEDNSYTTHSANFDQIYVPAIPGDLDNILSGQDFMVLEHPINRFKRKYLRRNNRLPFEENVSATIVPVVESTNSRHI